MTGTQILVRTIDHLYERLRTNETTLTLQKQWIEAAKGLIHKCVDTNPPEWWDSHTTNLRAFIWTLEEQIKQSEDRERDLKQCPESLLNQFHMSSFDARITEHNPRSSF